jgi:hypothetical protein
LQHRGAIDVQRAPPDLSAFEFRSTHTGPHSLDNKIAFQFGNRTNNHHNGTPERPTGIDVLAETDELDSEPVQFIQGFQQVTH